MMENQHGTAGSPILSILKKRELVNILVIVTRYFGGVLLGTGGLVKAYSEAGTLAIENGEIVKKENGYIAEITLEYNMQGDFEYICEKNNINIISKEFTEKIKYLIEISEEKYTNKSLDAFQKIPIILKGNKYINKD